ncbi:MAG: NAD(+)/NADH kinase, partial [Firmicutes bacterium]|nr:NAD(+)/NADH kinase [Bacillota bacterium]
MRNAYLLMHPNREGQIAIAEQIVSVLHAQGMTVSTEQWLVRAVGGSAEFDSVPSPDFVIAVGGDGTFLTAVQSALQWNIPLLGVNTGHIGFLIEVNLEQLPAICGRLKAGDYTIESRMTLDVQRNGETIQTA